jgi:hypothetical protein
MRGIGCVGKPDKSHPIKGLVVVEPEGRPRCSRVLSHAAKVDSSSDVRRWSHAVAGFRGSGYYPE